MHSRDLSNERMRCLVVVAHPDDETIWMGGAILRQASWDWQIFSLTRRDDPDRAPRFFTAAEALGASASMSDLDDSPTLAPLSSDLGEIKQRILSISSGGYDLVFTHSIRGEYTRHLRHEQVSKAVSELISSGALTSGLVTFAYDDCGGNCTPKPAGDAQILLQLTDNEHAAKRRIIRDIYNFGEGSFELAAAGSIEAFRVDYNGWTVEELRKRLS